MAMIVLRPQACLLHQMTTLTKARRESRQHHSKPRVVNSHKSARLWWVSFSAWRSFSSRRRSPRTSTRKKSSRLPRRNNVAKRKNDARKSTWRRRRYEHQCQSLVSRNLPRSPRSPQKGRLLTRSQVSVLDTTFYEKRLDLPLIELLLTRICISFPKGVPKANIQKKVTTSAQNYTPVVSKLFIILKFGRAFLCLKLNKLPPSLTKFQLKVSTTYSDDDYCNVLGERGGHWLHKQAALRGWACQPLVVRPPSMAPCGLWLQCCPGEQRSTSHRRWFFPQRTRVRPQDRPQEGVPAGVLRGHLQRPSGQYVRPEATWDRTQPDQFLEDADRQATSPSEQSVRRVAGSSQESRGWEETIR